MTRRLNMRAVGALAAAYALALQATSLAFAAPLGAQSMGFGHLPLCASPGSGLYPGHSAQDTAPLGRPGRCMDACLGCCSDPPACQFSGLAPIYTPAPASIGGVAFVAVAPACADRSAAHRCRAPPLA